VVTQLRFGLAHSRVGDKGPLALFYFDCDNTAAGSSAVFSSISLVRSESSSESCWSRGETVACEDRVEWRVEGRSGGSGLSQSFNSYLYLVVLCVKIPELNAIWLF